MNKKISLPDVTLLSITSVNIDQTQLALNISSLDIEFAKVKLLSSSLPSSKLPYIEYIQIPKINHEDYSRIMIKDLYKFFEILLSFQ